MGSTDQRTVLINGKVITPFRTIRNGGVRIRGSKIESVFSMDDPATELCDTDKIIDVKGRVIAPGFIDIHVHGGGGADLLDDDPDAVQKVARAHAMGGATAIVPTAVACSPKSMAKALSRVRNVMRPDETTRGYAWHESAPSALLPAFPRVMKNSGASNTCEAVRALWSGRGSTVLGVHLEGPYLSKAQSGAMDETCLGDPDPSEYEPLLEGFGDVIIRMTVAPELKGALELGRRLRQRGILASIGHSDATFEDVCRALEAGYTHVTHIYSAMSGVRRINGFRVPGVIEAALLLDELTVEAIGDGKHLPPSLLRLIYKCKGPDKMVLITDAMRAASLPEGEYLLGNGEGARKVIVEDGVAKLPDRSAFAGSVATMDVVVRNAVKLASINLEDAIKMATITPARVIGVSRHKGSLDPGKDADIVVFDEDTVSVNMTVVEGITVLNMLS